MRLTKMSLTIAVASLVPVSAVHASSGLTQDEQWPARNIMEVISTNRACGQSLRELGSMPADVMVFVRSHSPSLAAKYAHDEGTMSRALASNPAYKVQLCSKVARERVSSIAKAQRNWRWLQEAHARHVAASR